jgi:peptidyl-prolyl cis-trans isomerase B (cyclophilin B)
VWEPTAARALCHSGSVPGPDTSPRPRPARLGLAWLALAGLVLAACGQTPSSAPAASAAPSSAGSASGSSSGCTYTPSGEAAKPVNPPQTTDVPTSGTVTFTLAMTGGPVKVTLDRSKTPCTVNSFASLAQQGYFDGTKCHRLADSGIFVLQCGDPTGTGSGGPGYAFADELTGKESYKRGVVAMANAGPGTNGSQFFLVWDDSTSLDRQPNYTIFGQMDAASRDVVAQMAGEGQDGSNPDGTGKPNNPSEITKVTEG